MKNNESSDKEISQINYKSKEDSILFNGKFIGTNNKSKNDYEKSINLSVRNNNSANSFSNNNLNNKFTDTATINSNQPS